MAREKIDHIQRARAAWPELTQLARERSTDTYKGVSDRIGLHWRAAGHFLGVIQEECDTRGLPPLQALVVNSTTGAPGGGYHASERGGADYARALLSVFEHKWRR